MAQVSVVSADGLKAGAPTPGVLREIAFDISGATLMRARAQPRAMTDWHHHGERDVLGYVVLGAARFEFGRGGAQAQEVEQGGMFHVPAGLIHRDVNPLDAPQEIVLVVIGDGPLVINVEGPAS